jgi:DNA invertase Pin-like site-specific DNA recombinase
MSTKARKHTTTKRAALYLRVSTIDQTTANQERELQSAATRMGIEMVEVFKDHGVSGAKGREGRPQFDAMLKAVTRREIDLVMSWSVDRLGRSLQDLVGFLNDLHAVGCDLYLHSQGLDTRTPSGKAMFQMVGVFAEFERAIIQERIRAGLARARADGTRSGKAIGRPRTPPRIELAIEKALRRGKLGIHKIAKANGVGVGTVQRVKAAMTEAA